MEVQEQNGDKGIEWSYRNRMEVKEQNGGLGI